ncbi:MAG: hypothetical protein V1644_02740 [Candidatus Micrarchaeota archaeon]
MYENVLVSKHLPNLRTVIMVENTLKNMQESIVSVAELKRMLPQQVNHNTLMSVLEYLEQSSKIAVSLKGISWIYNDNFNLRNAIAKGKEL